MDNFGFIKYFGEQVGVSLECNAEGIYLFEIDGRAFSIYDLDDCDRIVLSGDVGYPPPGDRENLYKTLLEAQYMLKSTSGATFSINPDTGKLTLCKMLVPAILDNDGFFKETEDFVNALHTWANIISNYQPEDKSNNEGSSRFLNPGFISV